MNRGICLFSLVILLTKLDYSESTCKPIAELSSQQSWITWCSTNCGGPPGSYHLACQGDSVHTKCKCGEGSCNIHVDFLIWYLSNISF